MKSWKYIPVCFSLMLVAPIFSQTKNSDAAQTNSTQQAPAKAVHNSQQRDGNTVFEQNCSRCHTTPQGFSPRISGTVVRHMRVRAGLSKEDEQALLRFLNP
jgi:cytochrome c5